MNEDISAIIFSEVQKVFQTLSSQSFLRTVYPEPVKQQESLKG
jgi:hypothetical protein